MKLAFVLSLLAGCGGCGDVAARSDAMAIEGGRDAIADVVNASFDDLPDAGPPDLDVRGKHLLEAIAQSDLSFAADIVLPREAFVAARDATDPGGLYDSKFKPALSKQIARTHHHEKGVEHAVFVSFDIGPNPARVAPKKHEWKEPLWRTSHSTLTFTIEGRVHRIEVAEMIAWRGNWYVAKIH